MAVIEVTEEDAENRTKWRWNIRCGDPWWQKQKEKKITQNVVDISASVFDHVRWSLKTHPQTLIYYNSKCDVYLTPTVAGNVHSAHNLVVPWSPNSGWSRGGVFVMSCSPILSTFHGRRPMLWSLRKCSLHSSMSSTHFFHCLFSYTVP